MSDIFLSYDILDLDMAKALAEALELQGWTVFYDRTVMPGQTWKQFIGKEIDNCRCMIVVWSTHSVHSKWVEVEADIGLKRNILVPLLLDQVTPPLEFASIQAVNLVGWMGETYSSDYLALCKTLVRRLEPEMPVFLNDDKPNLHSNNGRKSAKLRRSKELTLKIGKITVIVGILIILLWYAVPVFVSYRDGPKVTNQLVVNEPEMQRIPAGSFQMGSNNGNFNETPVHPVNLKDFAIGRYEVTFDEYDQFVEALGISKPDDNGWGRGKQPVINVSWEDATAFAEWLSKETGKHYHLPTEAQWEYAARAGATSDFYWVGRGEEKDFAWFDKNSEDKAHPVGMKKPNAFGLYDMSGNVWEWVQDCPYDYNTIQAPVDGSAGQKRIDSNCSWRGLRGGSWNSQARFLRSAIRSRSDPVKRANFIGFRLAQE